MSTDNEELGWFREAYSTHGPFSSREHAIADARRYFLEYKLEGMEIGIGHVVYIKPEDFIEGDVGDILDEMDESLEQHMDLHGYENFEVPIGVQVEAKMALDAALKTWAAKYVKSRNIWYVTEEETLLFSQGGVK